MYKQQELNLQLIALAKHNDFNRNEDDFKADNFFREDGLELINVWWD